MEQMPSVLVNTKIAIPRQRSDAIQRTRLLQILDEQADANIYLIHAPAGYGKTTVVLDWIHIFQQKSRLISWYAIDASDNEKSTFAMYFTSSLAKMFAAKDEFEALIQRLRGLTDVDLMWLVKSILNLLSASQTQQVIILDDYHEIVNEDIHEAISYFLEYMPENVRAVVSTRTTPPFPLARWQVRARLWQVDQHDLKFSLEEVSRFLAKGMKLYLSTDQVAEITESTEGWAAGLQLAGINLVGNPDSQWEMQSFQGNQQLLLTYLMEEVYEHLPEIIQQFLLQSSVFPRFSAALCDAVLSQAATAQETINEIDRKHLFLVALDDSHTWFRYHHLFTVFLQTKFEREQPQEKKKNHLLASQWFKEQQFYREAVQQAFLSEDWQVAADLVCELGFYMIIHSEISVLYEWTVAFPEEVMQQNPLLCILQSWALVYRYQKQNRLRIEARLQQAEQAIAGIKDAEEVANLTEHMAVVRTFLAMAPDPEVDISCYLQTAQEMIAPYPLGHPGQYSAQLTIAYAYLELQKVKEAQDALLKARQSAFNGQLYFGLVEATFHLARLKQACGDLHGAKHLCLSAKAEVKNMLPNAEQILPALGSLDIALGCIQLQQNEIGGAMQSLQNGLTLLGGASNPFYLFVAVDALARSSLITWEIVRAERQLNQLSELWPDISFYSQGMSILYHLYNEGQLGDYERDALAWCNEMAPVFNNDFMPGIGPLGATEIYYQSAICWMVLKIALGQTTGIHALHQRLLDKAVDQGITQRMLELNMIGIFADWMGDAKDDAVRKLLELASLPEAQGYFHAFNIGTPLLEMILYLENESGISDIPALIMQLKETISQHIAFSAGVDQSALIEPLSERELEVMRFIGQGADNQQISEELFITVGTVKSHVNHIFRKLDARNRTEAVAKLRKLGMDF